MSDDSMLVVGLMSGTSMDGIDAALVRIKEEGGYFRTKLIEFDTLPYDNKIRNMIKTLLPSDPGTVTQLACTHYYLGEKGAEAALRVIRKARLTPSDIDLIVSSGQTVCNLQKRVDPFVLKIRLQIGEISVIAERTNITTVGDFRPREVAAGGEGAPLIPFFDYHTFRDPEQNRVILNIGGIANVTYIPAGSKLDDIRAFDTGPGNMLIDGAVRRLTSGRKNYDKNGRMAARGRINEKVLRKLMKHPFVNGKPPKSAGREEFGKNFLQELLKKVKNYNILKEDIITTVTAFTAEAIATNCKKYLGPIDEVIVSGGGAYNKTLLSMLQERMPNIQIATTEKYGIPIKAKEAMGFALLGYCTLNKYPNNVPSATGARRPVVMGKIVWK